VIEPKPIPGLPDYGATPDGRIWSHKSGKWKERVTMSKCGPGGYLKLNIYGKTERVADLVAITFIGPRPQALPGQRIEINHKDLNKQNNAVSNLEYLAQLHNIDHALKAVGKHGVKSAEVLLAEMLASIRSSLRRGRRPAPRGQCHGEWMPNRKLSIIAVRRMRTLHGVLPLSAIAKQFGVSKATAWRVCRGLDWRRA